MRHLFLLFVIAFSQASYAADPTPDLYASRFFETVVKGDTDKAIDMLIGSNPMMANKTRELQLMKSQLKTVIQIYGPASGAELVSKEELAPSLERRVYITKHDYHPVSWEMYFYKSQAGWIVDQFLFVDQYQVLGPKK